MLSDNKIYFSMGGFLQGRPALVDTFFSMQLHWKKCVDQPRSPLLQHFLSRLFIMINVVTSTIENCLFLKHLF